MGARPWRNQAVTLHDVIEKIIHSLQFHTEADKQELLDAVAADRDSRGVDTPTPKAKKEA